MTDKPEPLVSELKPCPFCGSEAVDRREIDGFPMIYCSGDDCFGPQTTASSFDDALVQWNTRARGPITTEQLDQLQFGRKLHDRPAAQSEAVACQARDVTRGGTWIDVPMERFGCNDDFEYRWLYPAPPASPSPARSEVLEALIKTRNWLDTQFNESINNAKLTEVISGINTVLATLTQPQGAETREAVIETLTECVKQLRDAGAKRLTINQVLGLIAFVRDGEGAAPCSTDTERARR